MKAQRLEPGDTIGIVSPSWGGAGLFPHRVELGLRQIAALGYRATIAPHALNVREHVSDTPEHRAADINQLFADPEVKMILATIGGDHSCQLLPYLDYELIRQNPKIFMGYSDITVLNIALYTKTGLVTFNGPALLPDFAEYPQMYDYTAHYMQAVIANPQPDLELKESPWWTDEFLDWSQKLDLTRPRIMQPSPGWTWLKPGKAQGTLLGGSFWSLDHLRGTPYWPDWQDAIFFLESGEEAPFLTPARYDSMLMDYENMGILGQLRGMLVGRPYGYSDVQKQALRDVILERTQGYSFPIITDMDFSHSHPQLTLPVGCKAAIDSETHRVALIEPAVE